MSYPIIVRTSRSMSVSLQHYRSPCPSQNSDSKAGPFQETGTNFDAKKKSKWLKRAGVADNMSLGLKIIKLFGGKFEKHKLLNFELIFLAN